MEDTPVPVKVRVLIADDEPSILETLKVILQRAGFEVATASSGLAAVETARHWLPDIFLSDVIMPEMNGFDAAILICEALPECKVVLISGNANTSALITEAAQGGCHFEVLAKPVPPAELIDYLRSPIAGLQNRDAISQRIADHGGTASNGGS